MTTPYLGQIEAFGFNFAPKGWALCQGQLLSIQQNAALFSLLGTFYGGNGVSTFALPDLRGRVAVGFGNAPSGSTYVMGEMLGVENVTLLTSTVPPHNHPMNAINNGIANGTSTPGSTVQLASGLEAGPAKATNIYATAPGTPATLESLSMAGGNTGHANVMPYLAITYCISLTGLFPTRG